MKMDSRIPKPSKNGASGTQGTFVFKSLRNFEAADSQQKKPLSGNLNLFSLFSLRVAQRYYFRNKPESLLYPCQLS